MYSKNPFHNILTHLQVLHPYYGLPYIQHQWGGATEQAAEITAGNPDVKNWQDEAMKHLEDMVRSNLFRQSMDEPCNLTRWSNTTSWQSVPTLPLPHLPPPLCVSAHTMHIPVTNIVKLSWRAMIMMMDGDQNSASGSSSLTQMWQKKWTSFSGGRCITYSLLHVLLTNKS